MRADPVEASIIPPDQLRAMLGRRELSGTREVVRPSE